ncbi:ABC transporter permease [Fusibacter ferrireducens]|uniref:ABC transporter permease n=1 Tax=Fusibacter ferrireducens TaxID=2785058 RepID=A0ABR9ZPH4_9FIRM|nr:ABC transporter permease [Fusibacter ferrireducens]MBF4692339.1 ABC transporter permease [Fusibacter ferrireducens]
MLKYIFKRLLFIVPTLLGGILIVFSIMNLTPGDPGRQILGMNAKQEQVDQLNHELGYDKPFFTRFGEYCIDLSHGDLGTSYRTRRPFTEELVSRIPNTLKIGLSAFVLSSIIGISLGILAAVRQYSLVDTFSSVTAILFASIPGFFLGMILIYVFGLKLGWLPTFGASSFKHFVMPVATLTVATSVSLLRLTRSTMLDAIRQDYIRTATAKGCSKNRIYWKHALKNAILPVITVMGMSAGTVMGGTVIIESVFAIPGMGTYMLTAIRAKDIPVVMSSTVLLSLAFCLIMILVDILCAIIDPRIRERSIG